MNVWINLCATSVIQSFSYLEMWKVKPSHISTNNSGSSHWFDTEYEFHKMLWNPCIRKALASS